jgi:hypothetical protein
VDVVQVLKGARKPGKTKLATIGQPMEKGRQYLMMSFGAALDTGFLANGDLAVVEIPSGFDLKRLDGKTVAEQAQLVLDARREQVRLLVIRLAQEKVLLEKTAPKPPEPAKLNPPEVKFTGAVERGGQSYLVFEVVNPNTAPIPYRGYTANSFEPKLAEGNIFPLHKAELLKGTAWKEDKIGWCGTGVGPVSVASQQKVRFEIPVPNGEWDEVRIGLVWYAAGYGKDSSTAWSKSISRKDVTKDR